MQRDKELTTEQLLQAVIGTAGGSPLRHSEHFHEEPQAEKEVKGRQTGRRRRDTKHELEQLRMAVLRLETKLARVKRHASVPTQRGECPDVETQPSVSSCTPMDTSIWMEIAHHQLRRRQQSHATNRQLKRLVSKQLKIARWLDASLLRKAHEMDVNTLLHHHLKPAVHSVDDELVFGSLLIHLQQLYATKDIHVKQAGLEADCLALHTERKNDSAYGTLYETASSVPLPFPEEKTDNIIADGLLNGHTKIRPLVNHANNRVVIEDRVHKNYTSTFQHRDNTYDLHSRTVIRKYTESNRSVYAWASVTVLASAGLRFFAQGMMIVEPSKTLPLNASVLKSWFRVYGVQIDSSRLNIERLTEGILKMQTDKMVSTFQWLENSLLDTSSIGNDEIAD